MIKIDLIELMKKEMFRRNYSRRTIKTYLFCLKKFLKYCHKEPRKFSNKDVRRYLESISDKGISGSTLNVNLQALKFMMENVLHKRKYFYNIKYSKVSRRMPLVLGKDEVIRLLSCIKNKKHNLMVKLIYSAGLRVSELLNLRVQDLDLLNNFGYVRKGKGDKDRIFIIADSVKQELVEFIASNELSSDSLLFKSYNGKMSPRSVQEILKQSAKKAKINKRVHPHALRHSFSTHLIENGCSVSEVQSLLGHKSPETTMVYIHMVSPKFISVKSPLDDLQLGNGCGKNKYEIKNLSSISPRNAEKDNLRI